MAKKLSKKSLGYIIPALLLIAGALFLYLKTSSTSDGALSNGYKSHGYFHGGVPAEDLDVRRIRWHAHNGYERLVFDIYQYNGVLSEVPYIKATKTGVYQIGREKVDALMIDGELSGYRAFSASMPTLSKSHIIQSIEILPEDESHYLFTIHLKKAAHYKVFTLKNPARIIIDVE